MSRYNFTVQVPPHHTYTIELYRYTLLAWIHRLCIDPPPCTSCFTTPPHLLQSEQLQSGLVVVLPPPHLLLGPLLLPCGFGGITLCGGLALSRALLPPQGYCFTLRCAVLRVSRGSALHRDGCLPGRVAVCPVSVRKEEVGWEGLGALL